MIEETSIADLDPRQIKQIQASEAAERTNPSYALEIYGSVLRQVPGCLELRKKLRALQIKVTGGNTKGFSKFFGKVTAAPWGMGNKAETDPEGSLVKAEEFIAKNPGNVNAHKLLADAAANLEMHKTVIFAYETVYKLEPDNISNLKDLGRAYLVVDDTENAIKTGNTILSKSPGDGEAEDLMKKASVAIAMHKGKWEESEDYRAQLKDEKEAQSLEQASKSVNDAKGLEDLIQQTYEELQSQPENLNNYRQLSDLYHRAGDIENAIAWIQEARKHEAGQSDVSLEKKERELTLEYYDDSIDQWKAALAAEPENADNQSGLDQTIAAKAEYHRAQIESLVERYPNDYGYRYELGRLLFDISDYDGAISQFQLAQRNANVRLDSIMYLGRAYRSKNFFDMAIEQFSSLKKELQVMDDRKKQAVYELGCCLEAMEKHDDAIEEFKMVYSADISYRDVSQKIDDFYISKQK